MAEGIYSKLVTNVPYEVPTKCCYFLSRSEIQFGHPGLWLADRDLLQTCHKCSLWYLN